MFQKNIVLILVFAAVIHTSVAYWMQLSQEVRLSYLISNISVCLECTWHYYQFGKVNSIVDLQGGVHTSLASTGISWLLYDEWPSTATQKANNKSNVSTEFRKHSTSCDIIFFLETERESDQPKFQESFHNLIWRSETIFILLRASSDLEFNKVFISAPCILLVEDVIQIKEYYLRRDTRGVQLVPIVQAGFSILTFLQSFANQIVSIPFLSCGVPTVYNDMEYGKQLKRCN